MLTPEETIRLKEIVGDQWVRSEPSMLDSYAFYMNPEILNRDGGQWLPRPAAVVMPNNTEEVTALVKLANELDISLKPISTGWGAWAAASNERVVVLDLKRMNKIIEIDVENQIAVVEPYVKAIVIQTELMKLGLNLHVPSCGGNHSSLASVTAGWGYGLTGSSMGYSGRNMLGVEWILPNGDLVQLGSSGHGSGWFTADGPGPSMRGVMRGFAGTFGGLGVFTKCAIKLYKWEGPKSFNIGGASPRYTVDKFPSNMNFFILSFPNKEAMADAGYLMGEAELCYAEFRTPAFLSAVGATEDNAELKNAWESQLFQKTSAYNLIISVMGYSQAEYDWKEKALKQILKKVRGVRLPLNLSPSRKQWPAVKKVMSYMEDPLALLRMMPFLQDIIHALPLNPELKQSRLSDLYWVLLRHATNTQGCFRPSQGMFTSLGSFDTWDLGIEQSEWIAKKKQDYIKQGLILDDGGDAGCGGTIEGCHMGYLEGIGLYSPENPASVSGVAQLIVEGNDAVINEGLGVPIAGFGQEMNNQIGPAAGNYHHWMAKIKKSLDPNTASDPYFYAIPGQESDAGEREAD